MNIDNCISKITDYMTTIWVNKMENNNFYDILKWSFSNNKNKLSCYHILKSKFWSKNNIIKQINQETINHPVATEKEKSNISNTNTENNYTTNEYNNQKQLQTSTWTNEKIQTNNNWIINQLKTWWWIIFFLILTLIILKFWRYIVSFFYDILNKHRMVYMKIIMPRLDTKADREREKDISKDMKEKIWRMAQVFRWIHKLGSLSTWDGIMAFLFDKAKVDLVYQYKKWELSFIIWIYPEYRNTIQANISAQYADYIIETIENFNIFSNKKQNDIIKLKIKKNPVIQIITL